MGSLGRQPSLGTCTPSVGTRSTCGNQVKSTTPSQPSYGFGTGTRDGQKTRFISDEHVTKDNAQAAKLTPGPGAYKHRVTMGAQHTGSYKQPESTLRTSSMYKFGSSERFDLQERTRKREAAVPGPGAYFI